MAHNSFWPASSEAGKLANRVFGALSGAVVYTSYARWCKIHNNHHNVSNNLDENQHAQTAPWSMRERGEAEPGTRRTFDAKYNALVQWIVGPWFVFFVVNRKCSAFENALWAAPLVACYAVGGLPLLLFEFAVSYVTAFTGMCLFHAQHTFDGVYKRRGEEWDFFENGLLGSSLLLIPEALKPFTLGIEYHHIHHLSTGVPSYKLRECHEAGEKKGLWDAVPTLPLSSIPATMPYAVWDEDGQEFLSVPQAQTRD
jgi:omega-6 fatty acid desaturase (delta-12 desaturase)